jgi:pimeloyl-ACP methyl ester carboxylesterase
MHDGASSGRTVSRGDHTIYYEVHGEGPCVLFFNGSGLTLESSEWLIKALARTCRVAAHDQRGLGKSGVPEGPYSMADYVADGAALIDHLGWSTCAVVGFSFGGMVAQEFTVTFPERVERLVLMCTAPGGALGASYPLHELASLSVEQRLQKMRLLTDSRFTDAWLAGHPSDAAIVAEAERRARAQKSATQLKGERLQLEARRHHDVGDRLHRITCPTFIAAGRYDKIAPVANSEAILSRIPHARLHVYEGGHMFLAQDASAIGEIVAFLHGGGV